MFSFVVHSLKNKISISLLDILLDLVDPRNPKWKQYELVLILTLVIIGMMCGRTGYTPIATWEPSQKALAKSIGWTDGILLICILCTTI